MDSDLLMVCCWIDHQRGGPLASGAVTVTNTTCDLSRTLCAGRSVLSVGCTLQLEQPAEVTQAILNFLHPPAVHTTTAQVCFAVSGIKMSNSSKGF